MKINELVITIFILQILAVGCSSRTEQANTKESEPIKKEEITQPERVNEPSTVNEDGLMTYGLVGNELFEAILDTITAQNLTKEDLIESKWFFNPFPDCISSLAFSNDGTGIEYNCEIEEDYTFTYSLNLDTLNVTEYHVPHVDNPEGTTLKMRDDKYLLNNNALILIASTMYNNAGIPIEPKIEVIIKYEKERN